MSATTMDGANPYNAPDANLDQGGNDVYQPAVFSFNGRIGRLRFLAYGVGSMLLLMAAMIAMMPLLGLGAFMGGGESMSVVGLLAFIGLNVVGIVIGVMFCKRRLNDLDRSGWWYLLSLVPFVNILFTIYVLFFPGTEGNNSWGPVPGPNSIGVKILAWSMPVLMLLGIVAAVAIPQMAGMAQ